MKSQLNQKSSLNQPLESISAFVNNLQRDKIKKNYFLELIQKEKTSPQVKQNIEFSLNNQTIRGGNISSFANLAQNFQADLKPLEKIQEEKDYEQLKQEFDQAKLKIIEDLQKTCGYTTLECRQALLFNLIENYIKMEKKVCYTSNGKLLERLKEFGIKIDERTLRRDLEELKKQGLIKVDLSKYQNENLQVRTARNINTFCPSEDKMESYKKFFKQIYKEISNKLLAVKMYLQEGLEKLKKRQSLLKQFQRKPENTHDVVNYFIEILRKPASDALNFFNYYSKKGWKDSGGKLINSWQGLAKVWNSY